MITKNIYIYIKNREEYDHVKERLLSLGNHVDQPREYEGKGTWAVYNNGSIQYRQHDSKLFQPEVSAEDFLAKNPAEIDGQRLLVSVGSREEYNVVNRIAHSLGCHWFQENNSYEPDCVGVGGLLIVDFSDQILFVPASKNVEPSYDKLDYQTFVSLYDNKNTKEGVGGKEPSRNEFKVGDKVRITSMEDNQSRHEVGYEFVIAEIFHSPEFPPWYREKEGVPRGVMGKSLELVEAARLGDDSEEAEPEKLKVGDRVEVVYPCDSKGQQGEVIDAVSPITVRLDNGKTEMYTLRSSLKKIESKPRGVRPSEDFGPGDVVEIVETGRKATVLSVPGMPEYDCMGFGSANEGVRLVDLGWEFKKSLKLISKASNSKPAPTPETVKSGIQKFMVDVVEFVKNSILSTEEKNLRKVGLKDSEGNYTSDAREIVRSLEAQAIGYKDYNDLMAKVGASDVPSPMEYAVMFGKYSKKLEEIAAEMVKEVKEEK